MLLIIKHNFLKAYPLIIFHLAKNVPLCPLKLQVSWNCKPHTAVKFTENCFLLMLQSVSGYLYILYSTCLVIQNDAPKIGAFQMNNTVQRLITRN